MSVQVNDITKIYGEQRAVDSISFEVKKGEILGFLGPNGAGKTTTMKILTCFIPQTSGKASVCGFDVEEEPLEVRKKIGYLPEHNPLYKDMYVKEYLNFVAGLYKLPNKKQRVAEMVEQTGLGREQHKLIGALSKGYRQRVGLAQAMIHNPEVLILDEPTSGLDPNQLAEIRLLIKNIGKEKTVIFSTHIMQEVQAICDRVIIINQGKKVADDPIDKLTARVQNAQMVFVEFKEKINSELFNTIASISSVKQVNDYKWQLSTQSKEDLRPNLFNLAVQNKLTLLELYQENVSVENVFQELTRSN